MKALQYLQLYLSRVNISLLQSPSVTPLTPIQQSSSGEVALQVQTCSAGLQALVAVPLQ